MTTQREDEVRIGWTELIDLPDWGVERLRAKIDTGARTSALHVENVQELPHGRVSFDVILHRAKRDKRVSVTTRIERRGRVRSSNGQQMQRIFVATRFKLGPVVRRIEISLSDRGEMLHRMLLGREALGGPFLIDVDRRNLLSPPRKKKKKKKAKKKVGERLHREKH